MNRTQKFHLITFFQYLELKNFVIPNKMPFLPSKVLNELSDINKICWFKS